MTPWHLVADAARSVRANGLRSLLTMLGIIIGAGSLITMLAVGAGAQARIAAQIGSLGANVLMVIPETARATGPGARAGRPEAADAEAIARLPEIAAAAPAVETEVVLVNGNRNWPTRVTGTTAAHFFVRDWPLTAGRGFSAREEARAGKVALLGATVAARLFGAEDPVGREIRILNTPMTVIGVLAPKGQSGWGRDQDDAAFVPFATATARLGAGPAGARRGEVAYIIAKAAAEGLLERAGRQIDALMRQRHRLGPDDPAAFRVTDPAAAMAARRGSTRTVGWLLAAIASVSLVVGGISIMNIMLVSVGERTREIGLRLAIGARPRDIGRLFLAEALLLCLGGGVLGAGAGIGAAWLVARLAGWPVVVLPGMVLAALGFAGAVGIGFGYYPARKAARLLPAAALRSP